MLKKRGNFPYDYNSKFPDPRPRPIPGTPYPYPPPATPPPVQSQAPPESNVQPPPEPQTHAAAPAPPPPAKAEYQDPPGTRYVMGVPRPLRRTGPLNPIRTGGAPTQDEPEPARHDRKCSICNHPYRETIEDDFVNWVRLYVIAREFDLTERSIARHARATGLYDLRAQKLGSAADILIECAADAPVTGETVLRAIRLRSRITPSVTWVEPEKRMHYLIEHLSTPATAPAPPPAQLTQNTGSPVLEPAQQRAEDPILIDTQKPLENGLSH